MLAALAPWASWCYAWTVQPVVSFVLWVNALPPLLGALVGAVSMLAVLFALARSFTYLKLIYHIEQLPGPIALPWLGNSFQLLGLLKKPHAWVHKRTADAAEEARKFRATLPFIKWASDFQPLFRVWLGPMPAVVITDPSVARKVLGPSGPLTKAAVYKFIHPWLKTGLLTSTGAKWRSRRKLITPSFHFEVLNGYFQVFKQEANVLADRLADGCATAGEDGIHVYSYVTNATLAIISRCAFGTDVATQAKAGAPPSQYVRAVNDQTESLFRRVLQPWTWSNTVYYKLTATGRKNARSLKILHNHTRSVIASRKAELLKVSPQMRASLVPKHFLDMLLLSKDAQGQPLDDDAVAEEVDTFMFEGHDTTASGLTWALYYIGSFPDIQARLQEEIDAFDAQYPDPTVSQVKSIPFLSAVIKETLRLSPPVPFLGRNVAKPMHIGKHYIPAGSQVFVCPVLLHHHEGTWGESWLFRPERFLPGYGSDGMPLPQADNDAPAASRRGAAAPSSSSSSSRTDPYAFLAFSAGSRNCIGQQFALLEEKVVLMTLLRRFTWETVPEQDVAVEAGIIMRPHNGKLRVRFTPRANSTR